MLPFRDTALEARIEGIAGKERDKLRLAIKAVVIAVVIA